MEVSEKVLEAIGMAIRAHALRANGFGMISDRQSAVAALLLDEVCEEHDIRVTCPSSSAER
jgi:hypothetical protein